MSDAKEKPKKAKATETDGAEPKAKKSEGKAAKSEGKAVKGKGDDSRSSRSGGVRTPLPDMAGYKPRMKQRYQEVILPQLMAKFGYKNAITAPRIDKIVLNMGVGETTVDTKKIQSALRDLTIIAGQKPIVTRARTAISNFKVREGMPLGVKVTLRRDRMYEFIDRLVTMALPRVRDFRGLNAKSFDGHGNYSLGLKEHIVFPEIDYDKVEQIWGMDITVCTTAQTDDEARELLRGFQFPFIA